MLHVADSAWLNIDAGETDDEPAELYALAHAVSIACGGHAGDAASMRRVLEACARHGTRAGAHPSYLDRDGFGRRAMAIDASTIERIVRAQCDALADAARDVGVEVTHAKAHGALYHAASADAAIARAFVAGAARSLGDRIAVVGPSGSALEIAACDAGLRFAREGFADRGVRVDGTLVPRGRHDLRPRRHTERHRHRTRRSRGARRGLPRGGRIVTFVPLGDGAIRIELPTGADPRAVLRALRAVASVVDVVVTEGHACIHFGEPPATFDAALDAIAQAGAHVDEPRVHVVRVRYDGADLADVAVRAGLSIARVVELHGAREYVVRVVGFLPGFAYLGTLDRALVLPRRASPRARVPAGAVAIAGDRTGIYPLASPGGWHLVGTAIDLRTFAPSGGALFALGDRVRFEVAT